MAHARLALLILPLCGVLLLSQPQPADLVLVNGKVVTVDPRDSIAEALAIRAGRIAFVGTSTDARGYVGERSRLIDLGGRTVTPGLIDTHVHFAEPADA